MLNQTGITTDKFGAPEKNILVDEFNSTAFSVVVSNDGVTADDGKKIIKAGTPVYGSLVARNTPFTVSGSGNPVGVILHDVDVTVGNANSQVVVSGFIDISKVDSDVATKLTSAEANLKGIWLVK